LDDLAYFESLESLSLRNFNVVARIDFANLKRLKNLSVIKVYSEEYSGFDKIRVENLTLNDLGISELPESIQNNTSLKSINLNHNDLIKIDGLFEINSLREIQARFNNIETLKANKTNNSLVRLDVGHNPIVYISEFTNLKKLEELNISYTKITDLKAVSKMTSLK
jgi:internalin A